MQVKGLKRKRNGWMIHLRAFNPCNGRGKMQLFEWYLKEMGIIEMKINNVWSRCISYDMHASNMSIADE